MTHKPVIQVYALGGTIAMTPGASAGVIPSLTATDLVAAVPGIDALADFRAETLAQLGSANLPFSLIADLCARAEASDADAVIVTQGTDSMEETSFLASLMYRGRKPLIFTGAMRSPNQPGADGPANLYDAAIVASDDKAAGVLLVMNGEVHDTWQVVKDHTASVAAFQSEYGPLGAVYEGVVHWRRNVPARPSLVDGNSRFAPVALVSAVLDDDGRILDGLEAMGFEGVVIEAFGAGHLSEVWADKAGTLVRDMPVILASRAKAGRVFDRTYGYRGAEIDLQARGLVSAGGLRARKARLLLSYLLGAETTNWKQSFTAAVKSV